jgi:hypothetical protein
MNATAHRLAAALALAAAAPTLCSVDENKLHFAAAGGFGGYCFGTLPDLIEPACNPHHDSSFTAFYLPASSPTDWFGSTNGKQKTTLNGYCEPWGFLLAAPTLFISPWTRRQSARSPWLAGCPDRIHSTENRQTK